MSNGIQLSNWIKSRYNEGLLKNLLLGSVVVFALCIFLSLFLQSSSNRSIANAFSTSIHKWILNGDLLQLRQVTGKLVSSETIDFVIARDANNSVLLLDDPFGVGERATHEDFFFSNGKGFYLYCEKFNPLQSGASFCFGKRVNSIWFFVLSLFFIAFLFLVTFSASKSSRKLADKLGQELLLIQGHIKNRQHSDWSGIEIVEVREIIQELNSSVDKERSANLKIQELATLSEIAKVTSQLAHDIRSPLAALEMVSQHLNYVREDTRVVVRNSINRIRDIANSLLSKERVAENGLEVFRPVGHRDDHEVGFGTFVAPGVDTIITEKRIEVRDRIRISIEYLQTAASYGLFAAVQLKDLQRVVSNIINNSVEAFDERGGQIDVSLSSNSHGEILLAIKDNGRGIPASLLPLIGVRKMTFGKSEGTGLGLHHAIETIESYGGKLRVESSEGMGTEVTISLPRALPPTWFMPELRIRKGMKMIVCDDDQSVHQIWARRIEDVCASDVSILHFGLPLSLRNYFGQNYQDLSAAVFLVDFEFLGVKESGLDLIEALGIAAQSILVTSRYEEIGIRERCERIGVQLIPKPMAGLVPIVVD